MHQEIPPALLELIDDDSITDILISPTATEVDSGSGLRVVDPVVANEQELANLASYLIEMGGRRLDQAQPFADVALAGGLRVHAVLKSGCSSKTLVSIRLHSLNPWSLEGLYEAGFLTKLEKEFLSREVANGSSFLIAGATGSGKTTLLRALVAMTSERVIALEDVSEITGENIISLQTRSSNIEGIGEVSLAELLRQSLRMRPDRLVVGEVRGQELITMLQALNTGHRGATTIHANSLSQIPQRLIAIAALSDISSLAVGPLAQSAFDWVINLENRKVAGIGKFLMYGDQLTIQQIEIG